MFNEIFKRNIKGRKHPGRWAFAEPELLCYRKPKRVIKWKNGHKILVIVPAIMMIWDTIKEIVRGTLNDTPTPDQRVSRHIGCDGVQLTTNAHCNMVPISISWNRESWTIQIWYTFETGKGSITVSYHPTHCRGHTKSWYVSLRKSWFNLLWMQL